MSLEYICLQEIAVNIFLNSDTFISIMSNFPWIKSPEMLLSPVLFWLVRNKSYGEMNRTRELCRIALEFYVLSSILISYILGSFSLT